MTASVLKTVAPYAVGEMALGYFTARAWVFVAIISVVILYAATQQDMENWIIFKLLLNVAMLLLGCWLGRKLRSGGMVGRVVK